MSGTGATGAATSGASSSADVGVGAAAGVKEAEKVRRKKPRLASLPAAEKSNSKRAPSAEIGIRGT